MPGSRPVNWAARGSTLPACPGACHAWRPPPPRSDGLAVTLGQRLVVLRGLRSPRPTPSVDFVSAVDAPEALTALAWLAAAGSGGAGGGAAAGALQGADAEASHARCSQHMQG